MRHWRDRYGPWAVVTGASSGIGQAMARQIAQRGCNVAVVARRRSRLESLCDDLAQHGVETRAIAADLGTPEGIDHVIDTCKDLDIGLWVANAGFGLKGDFIELGLATQLAMIQLNCASTVQLTHHFAHGLVERGRGGIIITSSTASFQGTPFTSVYAATKGFGLLFAEGIAHELSQRGVDVLALCPGPTDTEGPRRTGVNPDNVPNMMSAEEVSQQALRSLGKRRLLIPGAVNRFAASLTRLVPRSIASNIAARLIQRATE